MTDIIITAEIERKIFFLRGHRVMLDRDLAALYGVSVKRLSEQVKRNRERFPPDFIFKLTKEETRALLVSRSQIATLKQGQNVKYAAAAFTEHGAVMLANVFKNRTAVRVSIQVVRAFVRLRQALATHKELAQKIELLERRVGKHDVNLKNILDILRKLLDPPPFPPKRPMGFLPGRGNSKLRGK
ncbi:MAG TPA: ORF6N domain-containing protein [Candidatus Paceibacterota bacterium]|jgi:phage regulator Rha-like protein|nr:ORF6N domain-containing protein [Candidatus Paceibacterota bacterium]